MVGRRGGGRGHPVSSLILSHRSSPQMSGTSDEDLDFDDDEEGGGGGDPVTGSEVWQTEESWGGIKGRR